MGGNSTAARRAGQDDFIMGTNTSSIVSKRSVERIYFEEPHFFRYFVKKPQRRSPLINRGYWFRMYAMKNVVDQFLHEFSDAPKVILNLGCGYDPTAFQWLAKQSLSSENVIFVDIDYPELIASKVCIILETPQLLDLLGPLATAKNEGITPLRTKQYIALGCNLANTADLNDALTNEIDLKSCRVLCLAEISITYMTTAASNSLIRWAGLLPEACFCLLEQFLPNGPDSPFAQKMLKHFEMLQTPLKSIRHYQSLESQEHRFLSAGWSSARANSLWDLWNDSAFIQSVRKIALNAVEPFDEWEDFALFASHYFLLVAKNNSKTNAILGGGFFKSFEPSIRPSRADGLGERTPLPTMSEKFFRARYSDSGGHRKFGSIISSSDGLFGHHGGIGSQARLTTTHFYKSDDVSRPSIESPPPEIEPRMCHTITVLPGDSCMLLGGRKSPDRAMSDCWLYRDARWERVNEVPMPLYRHCAVAIGLDTTDPGVLVFGGRSHGGRIVNVWFLWRTSTGWVQLRVLGSEIQPRFGAVMSSTASFEGIVFGGLTDDGSFGRGIWRWSIQDLQSSPSVHLTENSRLMLPPGDMSMAIYRFGACLTWSSIGLLLIGGISQSLLPQDYDIVCLTQEVPTKESRLDFLEVSRISYECEGTSPLLIGHSVGSFDDSIFVVGGGAVCFSFGSYWNRDVLTLDLGSREHPRVWGFDRDEICISGADKQKNCQPGESVSTSSARLAESEGMRDILRLKIETSNDFVQLINNSQPFIIEGMDLGPCQREWTLDLLKARIGPHRFVTVHEADERHMDFQAKNFRYVTTPFASFIDRISSGSREYLRSLAVGKPATKPAEFESDFPELAADFKLPAQLDYVSQNAHSSPLRISGAVIIWLHYDVMANILCQIQGLKHIVLYPPSDVSLFNLAPGASSSSMNVFDPDAATKHPCLRQANPQGSILKPGEILYIPPFWLHTAAPVEKFSISINVFFRNLASGYSAGRDIYGNRDLQAYENGRREIQRICKSFDALPRQIRSFYLERLAGELQQLAQLHES